MRTWLWLLLIVSLLGVQGLALAQGGDAPSLSRLLQGRKAPREDPRLARIAALLVELQNHPLAEVAAEELAAGQAVLRNARRWSGPRQRGASSEAVARAAELAWAYLSLAGRKLAFADARASYRASERVALAAERRLRQAEASTSPGLIAPRSQDAGVSQGSMDARALAPDIYARVVRAHRAALSVTTDELRDHFRALERIWLDATTLEAKRLVLQRKRMAAEQRRLSITARRLQVERAIAAQRQQQQNNAQAVTAAAEMAAAYRAWAEHRAAQGKRRSQTQLSALAVAPVLLQRARLWVATAASLGAPLAKVGAARAALVDAKAAVGAASAGSERRTALQATERALQRAADTLRTVPSGAERLLLAVDRSGQELAP